MQKLVQPQPQPQPQPGMGGAGGPSQPAVGPSPIATILQTSPSSIATTVPLAIWFELAPLRDAPFWREHEVLRPPHPPRSAYGPLRPLTAPHGPLRPLTAPYGPLRPLYSRTRCPWLAPLGASASPCSPCRPPSPLPCTHPPGAARDRRLPATPPSPRHTPSRSSKSSAPTCS